jgi:MFS family permease
MLTTRQLLAIPGVRRLWTAQLISIAGDFLAIFAVLSMVSFHLHGTPAQITGVTVSYMLPLAVLGPVAGVFADRWNPRRTMITSDLIRAGLVVLLLAARTLPEIYAILFAISAVSVFFIPAQSILVRTLVPKDSLLSVNAMLQQAMLLLRILSPALAGALVAKFGPNSCFALDALSFLASAALLCDGPATVRPIAQRTTKNVLNDLSAGIRFILSHSAIAFILLAMAAATFAISCATPLLALLVRDILHADVRFYGFVSAMLGLGMVAGTQSVRRLARFASAQQLVLCGLATISTGILLVAVTRMSSITVLGAFAIGAGAGFLTVPAQTLIQSETPLPMVGRVSSGVLSLVSLAQILGLILSGFAAAAFGLRPVFLASAVMLAGLTAIGHCKMSHLTKLNTVN